MQMKPVVIDRPTILLSFSGGLDSTGALHMLLTDEKYRGYVIHCHHVQLINPERRHSFEKVAVERIIRFYSRRFPGRLTHSLSIMSSPIVNRRIMYDSDVVKMIAGFIDVSSDGNVKKVAIGVTSTDDEDQWVKDMVKRGYDILDLYLAESGSEMVYPVRHMSKGEVYDMLPPMVRSMTWSCRRPIMEGGKPPRECGECKPCKDLIEIRRWRQ